MFFNNFKKKRLTLWSSLKIRPWDTMGDQRFFDSLTKKNTVRFVITPGKETQMECAEIGVYEVGGKL